MREVLGGDSLKTWRQDNQEDEQLRQVELPSGIAECLKALAADMWQTAIDIANNRLVKECEALESDQIYLLHRLDEVTSTVEAAAITVVQITGERDTLTQTLSDTHHPLERVKADTELS